MKKIVLIGAGALGTSFIYAALNSGMNAEFVIIDLDSELAEGHKRDLADACALLARNSSQFKVGTYHDCKDANLIIITAGRPQKSASETRLDMLLDNVKIITSIANNIKQSCFEGITIIVSNPVDIMATVFQKITNFPKEKVLSSGTNLDSGRFRKFMAEQLKVATSSIHGFVIGEHGDSSIPIYSQLRVGACSLDDLIQAKWIDHTTIATISIKTYREAYEIIKRKKATYYGIANSLLELTEAILYDQQRVFAIGILLDNKYLNSGIYFSLPAILGKNGWKELPLFQMNSEEQFKFNESSQKIQTLFNELMVKIQ